MALSALEKVLSGQQEVTPTVLKKAFAELQKKYQSAERKVAKSAQEVAIGQTKVTKVANQVMTLGETGGAFAVSQFLDGAYGKDKLKLAGVDARLILGVLAEAYGYFDLTGEESGLGEHAINIGNGLLLSVSADYFKAMGQDWKGGQAAKVAAEAAQTTPAQTPAVKGVVTPLPVAAPQAIGALPTPILTPAPVQGIRNIYPPGAQHRQQHRQQRRQVIYQANHPQPQETQPQTAGFLSI